MSWGATLMRRPQVSKYRSVPVRESERVRVRLHGGRREHFLERDQFESGVDIQDGGGVHWDFLPVVSAAARGLGLMVMTENQFRNDWKRQFHSGTAGFLSAR
jgi:hypothetical protein